MTELTRRLLLGSGIATILISQQACAGAIIFSGGTTTPSSGPTGLALNPSTINLVSLVAGTKLTTMTMQGGTLPMSGQSLTGADAGKLQIANVNNAAGTFDVQVKSGATASPSTNWSFGATVTDTNSLTFTSATNAYAVIVPAAPTVTAPNANVDDNATSGTLVTNVAVSGGTPPFAFTDLDSNSNYQLNPTSGSSSEVVVSPTGPGSIGAQLVHIRATDALGFPGTAAETTITVVDHTASTKITGATFTVKRTIVGTQSANFVTKIFRQNFVRGDIVAGTYPIFKTTIGSTNCPYSIGDIARWNDGIGGTPGSMKSASFMMVVPVNVANGTPVSIDIWTNGSKPADSSRSLADFATGGHVFQVEVDGTTPSVGLSGTWIASLNDAVGQPDSVTQKIKFMDGQAGAVWRVEVPFKQSGSAHGQLITYFYCAALEVSGALYGLRMMPRMAQPYFDVTSPAQGMRAFSRIQLTDNGSLIIDPWANAGKTTTTPFSWVDNGGGSPAVVARYSVTAAGPGTGLFTGTINSSYGCMISGGTTLPANLSASTFYFCTYAAVANRIALSTDSKGAAAAALNTTNHYVTASDAGTGGPFTLTLYPYLCQFASLYVCPSNGLWNYQQGAGSSAADDSCRVVPNNTYLRASAMIPPYNYVYGASTTAADVYYFNGSTSHCDPTMTSSGEREELAPIPNIFARFVQNLGDTDETTLRVFGLAQSNFATCLRANTIAAVQYKTLPNGANDTAYTNIAQPSGGGHTFRWLTSTASFAGAPSTNQQGTYSEIIGPHMWNGMYGPAVIFGEPQYIDMVMEHANRAIYNRTTVVGTPTFDDLSGGGGSSPQKNFKIGGVNYYGCSFGTTGNVRGDGWDTRDVAWAASIAAVTSYDGADYRSYFNGILTNSFNMMNAWRALCPNTYANTNGLISWHDSSSADTGWMQGYIRFGCCIAAGPAENDAALTFLTEYVKWPGHVYDVAVAGSSPNPSWIVPDFNHICFTAVASPRNYIPDDNHIASTAGMTLTWSGGVFHYSHNGTQTGTVLTPAVNDRVQFYETDGATNPGAFSKYTPYWVVSVNTGALTLELASSLGGTPIVPTGASSSNVPWFPFAPAANSSTSPPGADSYWTNLLGNLSWATAVFTLRGASSTVNTSLVADLQALAVYSKAHYAAWDPVATPKYWMQTSF